MVLYSFSNLDKQKLIGLLNIKIISMENINKLISLFNFAAVKAGEKIMENYGSLKYVVKNDGSPITKADIEANKTITKILRAQFKDIKIISEENDEQIDCEKYILIDPLDGTKEFLSKNGEFTVNIALIINGNPILGCIYLPFKKELFWNDEKNSYYKANNHTKKIFTQSFDSNSSIAEVSRSHLDIKTKDFINMLKPKKLNKSGSSIKICNIAQGKSHIYPRFGNINYWDIAAGHSILKKAGGDIFDLSGKKILYKKKQSLVQSFIAFSEKNIPRDLIKNAQKFI